MVALWLPMLVALALNVIGPQALPTIRTRSLPDPTKPVLVVVLKPGVRPPQENLTTSSNFSSVQGHLDAHGASLNLMFGQDEDSLLQQLISDGMSTDMASFYSVQGPPDKLDQLAEKLLAEELVEAAYVKPGYTLPVMYQSSPKLVNDRRRGATPNFVVNQTYLGPAPGGIEAVPYASGLLGGQGQGVHIIDVESAWQLTHEDLTEHQGGLVGGQNKNDSTFINHGTAVAGIIGGDLNDFGITGIVPDADFRASSDSGQTRPAAIKLAADKLNAGDIILLELQRPGPLTPDPWQGQQGFIPVEWWPDEFSAIRYAVAKGILVVEAAGNGNQDLDNPIYEKPLKGFPSNWTNPFNPANPQSGAILVSAGSPSTVGNRPYYGADRSRLSYANYGQRIDVQGHGAAVVTTGYGDLQGGPNQDRWYTNVFGGTSSAAPIITGALAVVQGVLLANGQQQLTPARAIELLRCTGSPQQSFRNLTVSQRIGNRPDLRQLIAAALDGNPLLANDTTARARV
ncbi:MAG: hypothetical protein M1835_005336 [Candelina submexicana]|nr:MAG: hypothetical protein M1835_005336 [Candelina submexicana]